jgi:ATP-dependent DNA helicase RecG
MGLAGFKELFTRLRTGDESVEIEAKRGSDAGKSLLETVCAFANEPQQGGGYILLGVTVEEDALLPEYEVVGVDKPDQLQADIASQCRELFSTPIRPEISVEQHDGKNILVVYVPEATPHDKPVYIKSKGIHKGSFRRIGSSDQTCTDDDLAVFYQARGQRSFDDSPLPDTTLDDIDEGALAEYRRLRAHNTVENELLTYQDEDLLFALGAISRNGERPCLTLAGLVVFGKPTALRRHLPMTRVDYIRVEGREWVPDPTSGTTLSRNSAR